MKSTALLLASCLFSNVLACGFANAARGTKAAAWKAKRAELAEMVNSTATAGPGESDELLGDLLTQGPRSPVGQLIADILTGRTNRRDLAQDTGRQTACRESQCCAWMPLVAEMWETFTTPSGRCSALARGAIRLGFHDAGAWRKGANHGGADGSILLTNELETRGENRGLEEIGWKTREWHGRYRAFGLGMADIIQMGANVATVTCPLGPRVRTFVGRRDSATMPEPNLLPDARDSADKLISLFQAKTISPNGLVALVGAHSTSQQRFFDRSRALDPQDSTPGVWDVLFYSQTSDNRPKRIVKFPSDINLSRHPRTRSEWDAFAGPSGQQHWNDDYAREYVRLSLLGVNNINELTDCTHILPTAITGNFRAADQYNVDQWANGGFQGFGSEFGALVGLGEILTDIGLQQNGIDPSYVSSGWGTVPKEPQDFRGNIQPGAGIPRPKPDSKPRPPKAPGNGAPNGNGKDIPPNNGGRPNKGSNGEKGNPNRPPNSFPNGPPNAPPPGQPNRPPNGPPLLPNGKPDTFNTILPPNNPNGNPNGNPFGNNGNRPGGGSGNNGGRPGEKDKPGNGDFHKNGGGDNHKNGGGDNHKNGGGGGNGNGNGNGNHNGGGGGGKRPPSVAEDIRVGLGFESVNK